MVTTVAYVDRHFAYNLSWFWQVLAELSVGLQGTLSDPSWDDENLDEVTDTAAMLGQP